MIKPVDGLTESRLREVLVRVEYCVPDEFGTLSCPICDETEGQHAEDQDGNRCLLKTALAIPKTQAEKEISKVAGRIRGVETQIQWCHDKLGTNLNRDDMATVQITLHDALKDLKTCWEANLE